VTRTPWVGAIPQYAGWVPNALGHLSFSLIGQGTLPGATAVARGTKTGENHVAVHQTRSVDDYGLPHWIMRWFRFGTTHDWTLVGSTAPANYPNSNKGSTELVFKDDRGMLRGQIFMLPEVSYKGSTRQERKKARKVRSLYRKEASQIILRARRMPNGQGPADRQNQDLRALNNRLQAEGVKIGTIEFALLRTGEVRFWIIDATPFDAETDEEASIKIAYLFLKDVAHRHAHHHHSQDSLLPLTRVDGGHEIEWQRQSIWALSRSIEDNLRRGKRKALRAALGMMPYAENFHQLHSNLVRSAKGKDGFEKTDELDHYSYESLRKSVTVQLETRSWWLAGMTAASASFFAICLSSVIAITNLAPNREAHWPAPFAEAVAARPILVILFILLLLWMTFEVVYREAVTDSVLFRPMRFITRLSIATAVSLTRRWPARQRIFALLTPLVQLALVGLGSFVVLRLLGVS
jgi:hypothetical protein